MSFKDSLIVAVKEIARIIIFAVPGALIIYFTQNPEVGGAYGVIILAVLRAVDKAIHDNSSVSSNGLLPF